MAEPAALEVVLRQVGRPRGAEAGLCLLSLQFRLTSLELRVVCGSRVYSVINSRTSSCHYACCWYQSPLFADVCKHVASSPAAAASMSTWRRSTGQRSDMICGKLCAFHQRRHLEWYTPMFLQLGDTKSRFWGGVFVCSWQQRGVFSGISRLLSP